MIKQTRKEHKNNKHNKNRKHNKRLKYPSIIAEFDPIRTFIRLDKEEEAYKRFLIRSNNIIERGDEII